MSNNFQNIAVSQLVPSKRNVRRTGGQSIEELAGLIRSHGVVQNLSVVPIQAGKHKGKFEVIAGGRRLQALRSLVREKTFAPTYKVPCKVVASADAEDVSLVENSGREALHPADQFDCFKKMADDGKSIEDIAARFGVTPLVVSRRLALARVSPALIAAYRNDEMTLEQLMAFTVSDDHRKQEAAWYPASRWEREPNAIRAKLAPSEISTDDARALFVGVSAYEAAGGMVRRDLFDADGGGFLLDVELLDRLVSEGLDRARDELTAEGWAFVQVQPRFDFTELHSWRTADAPQRKPTKAEKAELKALRKEADALGEEADAGPDEARETAIIERQDEIDARIEAIEESLAEWTPEARALHGVYAGLSDKGQLRIERGLIAAKASRGSVSDTAGHHGAAKSAPKPAVSGALARRLTIQRTLGLRIELARNSTVALVASVHALTLRTFFKGHGAHSYHRSTALELRYDDVSALNVVRPDDPLAAAPAYVALKEMHGEWLRQLPEASADLWVWLLDQPQARLLDLLAYCTAQTVNAVQEREDSALTQSGASIGASDALASALELNMANWWSASAGTYLAHIPRTKMIDALRDAGASDVADAVAKAKKDGAIAAATPVLTERRWLPALLRTPELRPLRCASALDDEADDTRIDGDEEE